MPNSALRISYYSYIGISHCFDVRYVPVNILFFIWYCYHDKEFLLQIVHHSIILLFFSSKLRAVQFIAKGPVCLCKRSLSDARLDARGPVYSPRWTWCPEFLTSASFIWEVHQGWAAFALWLRALLSDIFVSSLWHQRVRGAGNRDGHRLPRW